VITLPPENRKRIVSYFLASLLYWAGQYIFVPTLPAFALARVASLTTVGVVLSMYGLWSAVLRVPTGILHDTTRRSKALLVGGFLLAVAGALVMGRGRTVAELVVGRALTGASTATWVPVMVVVAGFFPPERTVFATSLLATATSVGQVMATASTGFLNKVGGYPLAFFVGAGLVAAAALIIALTRLPAFDHSRPRAVSARSILAVFARRDVLLPSFASAACQFGVWAIVFAFLPLLAHRVGAGDVTVSLLMTVNLLANTASNLYTTLRVRKTDQRVYLFASFGLFAAGALLAGFSPSVAPMFVATCLMGTANGIFYPILLGLSIERVDLAHRTTAMGIHQAVYALGMFCGPWIGGVLADALGIRPMFAIMAGVCVSAASALVLLTPGSKTMAKGIGAARG
jgi:MFS family permease